MRYWIFFILASALQVTSVYGQFRSSNWNMTFSEVIRLENIPEEDQLVDKFNNGKKNLAFKSSLELGGEHAEVYSNFLFVYDKLKSGSYVFTSLDDKQISDIVESMSEEFGSSHTLYGNTKFERLREADRSIPIRTYLDDGYGVKVIWNRDSKTAVVLRIVNTRSSEFGTWGWLTYYENSFYRQTVQPEISRGLGRSLGSGR